MYMHMHMHMHIQVTKGRPLTEVLPQLHAARAAVVAVVRVVAIYYVVVDDVGVLSGVNPLERHGMRLVSKAVGGKRETKVTVVGDGVDALGLHVRDAGRAGARARGPDRIAE